MQHVPRANAKILYEDPLERKRRERELRISQERIELAQMQDPFSKLGSHRGPTVIERSTPHLTLEPTSYASTPVPTAHPLQSTGLAAIGATGATPRVLPPLLQYHTQQPPAQYPDQNHNSPRTAVRKAAQVAGKIGQPDAQRHYDTFVQGDPLPQPVQIGVHNEHSG